jgi:hypothetical protein
MDTKEKQLFLEEWYGQYQLDTATPSGKAVVQWYESKEPRHATLALLTMLAHALDELDKAGATFH